MQKVAKVVDVPQGRTKCVSVNGLEVALFNVGGKIFATQNQCLHKGGPLCEGDLEGNVVTCPWHGFQYDVRTGANEDNPSLQLRTFKVEIKDGEVFLQA